MVATRPGRGDDADAQCGAVADVARSDVRRDRYHQDHQGRHRDRRGRHRDAVRHRGHRHNRLDEDRRDHRRRDEPSSHHRDAVRYRGRHDLQERPQDENPEPELGRGAVESDAQRRTWAALEAGESDAQ